MQKRGEREKEHNRDGGGNNGFKGRLKGWMVGGLIQW